MSNSSIEGRIRGLQERFENEMRIQGEGNYRNQGGLGAPRPGGSKRPKPPPIFPNREIPVYPPRSPQATETEYRMREVYKVSGKLNVDGVEYRSHIDELQHLGELGSGTCGQVVKMLHRSSGAVIAVKQMRRSGNSEETKRILMDLDVVVRSHDCPYIVRCLGCFVTDADVWICMELMASCFDKLLKRLGAPIPEAILGKVTVATVNALSYLKDTHGVIHRDVKPSNILLDERGNIKLCDFGISGRLVDSKAKTRSAGCAAYMAPERIDPPDPTRPDYDIRADVWSLGISLVELATGVFPYRDCQNDFEVLTRVISDEPPQLPEDSNFSPEFKSFVSQCLTKNYKQRPKYAKLLEHPFVVKSARNSVSVGAWYAALPIGSPDGTKMVTTVATHSIGSHSGSNHSTGSHSGSNDSTPTTPQPVRNFVTSSQHWTPDQATPTPSRGNRSAGSHTGSNGSTPTTPQPVRNFVTSSQHWTPDQATPTPSRPWWTTSSAHAGGSSSQPTSLETDFANHSPYPRRRTIDACASPPPPPVRRLSTENRWRPSPGNSGNTSPIVLARFQHQSQQRRSRLDRAGERMGDRAGERVERVGEGSYSPALRHRSLGKEHGRSPDPPPRTARPRHHLNGSMDLDPHLSLQERLLHPPSPLLFHERLQEPRSQSLTRAELRNGYRKDLVAPAPNTPKHHHQPDDQSWLHSLAGLVKRRLSGYVKWNVAAGRRERPEPHGLTHRQPYPLPQPLPHARHRWNSSESWSVPASPLPPRAPPPRPAD